MNKHNIKNIQLNIKSVLFTFISFKKAFDGDGVVGNSNTDIAKIWSDGSIQWVPESIYR